MQYNNLSGLTKIFFVPDSRIVLSKRNRRKDVLENQDQLQQLLEKYRDNRCSPEEVKLLLSYFHKDSQEQDQLMELVLVHLQEDLSPRELDSQKFESFLDRAYLAIEQEIADSKARSKANRRLWQKIGAAATIFITVGILSLYYINRYNTHIEHPLHAQDIAPGGNKATLTVNGKTIQLSNTQSGIIDGDNGIFYNNGTAISDKNIGGLVTIKTPKGGEYEVVLPDGSKVRLNAATTLQYSADLRERGKRKVVLVDGEAYFEVTKNKKLPFVVVTKTQEVEVLGTHFNINSYSDQDRTVTTLEEGSVKVWSVDSKALHSLNGVILKPGQQSLSSDGKLSVQDADLATALAWRNGLMKFKNTGLRSILQEASRWYDIEVEYHGEPSSELFTGGISRSENLDVLLKVLQLNGVTFKIIEKDHHRKLIVNP